MKAVFLNTWNARVRDKIIEYIKYCARDTDVFCLQEVYDDETRELFRRQLPDYYEIFAYKQLSEDHDFGQATYVKDAVQVVASGTTFEGDGASGLAVYDQLEIGGVAVYL